MHWTDRREKFRAVLSGARCVHPGSVYDAISARILPTPSSNEIRLGFFSP